MAALLSPSQRRMKRMGDLTREAVARAIYESRNGRGCAPWSRLATSHKQPYQSDADAALNALQDLAKKRAKDLEVWIETLPKEPNDAVKKLFADYRASGILSSCEEQPLAKPMPLDTVEK